jgi:hypothetical protein
MTKIQMKLTNQNKLTAALILIVALVCFLQVSPVSAQDQALKVRINVNSKVGVQQYLPFESMPENNIQAAAKGSVSRTRSANAMGAYTITGKENTDVLIRLDAPEVLVNKEKQTTPYQMKLAWQNTVPGDVNAINWSTSKDNVFKLSGSMNVADGKQVKDDDSQAYLYLSGYAEVPANAGSPFEGNVKLTIEY